MVCTNIICIQCHHDIQLGGTQKAPYRLTKNPQKSQLPVWHLEHGFWVFWSLSGLGFVLSKKNTFYFLWRFRIPYPMAALLVCFFKTADSQKSHSKKQRILKFCISSNVISHRKRMTKTKLLFSRIIWTTTTICFYFIKSIFILKKIKMYLYYVFIRLLILKNTNI